MGWRSPNGLQLHRSPELNLMWRRRPAGWTSSRGGRDHRSSGSHRRSHARRSKDIRNREERGEPSWNASTCTDAGRELLLDGKVLQVQVHSSNPVLGYQDVDGAKRWLKQMQGSAPAMSAVVAGISGTVAVGGGAFGFHGLRKVLLQANRDKVNELVRFWEIATQYALFHSSALLVRDTATIWPCLSIAQ